MSYKLDNNAHSVFLSNHHLVMLVKYRKSVISKLISLRLKEIFEKIAANYNIYINELNHESDNDI